jgi:hypothetical protein
MTRAQEATIIVGLLLCIGAYAYPPFVDPYVFTEGPVFAWITQPPPAANEMRMEIDWTVLQAEWAIVVLITASIWLYLSRRPMFSLAQRIVLWSGAGCAVYRLLNPPYIGGGPLGIHIGYDSLFHRSREYMINVQAIDIQLITIALATIVTFWIAGLLFRRQPRMDATSDGAIA